MPVHSQHPEPSAIDEAWRLRNRDPEASAALAEQVVRQAATEPAAGRARVLLAMSQYRCADYAQVLEHLHTALPELADDPLWLGRAYLVLANTSREIGAVEQSAEYFVRTTELALSLGDGQLEAMVVHDQAESRGTLEDVIAGYREALRLLAGVGDTEGQCFAEYNLAWYLRRHGAAEERREAYQLSGTAARRAAGLGVVDIEALSIALGAQCLIDLGDVEGARRELEAATTLLRRTDRSTSILLTVDLAELHLALGEPLAAASLLADLLGWDELTEPQRVLVLEVLSRCHAAAGDHAAAYQALREHVDRRQSVQDALGRNRANALEVLHRARRAEREAARARDRVRTLSATLEDLQDATQLMWESSVRDVTTGVYNRRYFDEQLAQLSADAAERGEPLSLVLLDIDHFKVVNDSFGHLVGDQVLADLGALLRRHARPSDVVTRYGGEEFAILQPRTPLPVAEAFAERLREAVADYRWTAADPGRVTISAGVASALDRTDDRSLIRAADRALYDAKAAGRNRVAAAS
ncbi:GGDEF domain-containing protein [Arsenicicoccus piscis]|uniref:diguanylate cyclase n=1 Tax=Arsenicicoccus piscis TaxID=673954 RepID=UPI001F4CEDAB|nr:GGDEF domain-containing protein [Arsenicicoccus piscis]